MKKYTVQQLSEMAGTSVRALHHYDEIGLLKPHSRSEKGYRYYTREQLLQLQQIMLYRELEVPLKEIAVLLQNESHDIIKALEVHKISLIEKIERVGTLLNTIDKTIELLKNKQPKMTDEELYEGFSKEKVADVRKEVKERWGEDELLQTEERLKQMDRQQWTDVKEEGDEINRLLADLIELPVDHILVQKAIEQHYKHMNRFYKVSKERYIGLGNMYVDDERFTEYYDKYTEGLSVFIRDAILVFCKNGLKVEEVI